MIIKLTRFPKLIEGRWFLITNYKLKEGGLVIKPNGCWMWPLDKKTTLLDKQSNE